MSSDQQQQTQSSASNTFQPPAGFDKMSEQEQKQSYMEWAKQKYNEQYESWMPWIEDYFLKWFTKDNKASYATKGKPWSSFAPCRRLHPLPSPSPFSWLGQSRKDVVANTSSRNIEQLGKTKVTGVEQVDTLQDGVHNLVAGQVGQGGLLQPVGDLVSKEGANRAERQGKDDKGSYLPTSLPKVPGGLLG
ncbi:C6 zinc finger protein [Apiospora phragmitis]|uniref:C6 zinc finger protein n=1 Tax=Apiospora phragmitis TaxID=2905665 RepID=A0ABR1T5B9_9PEZI